MLCGLALTISVSGCKRPHVDYTEQEDAGSDGTPDTPAGGGAEMQPSYLDPLLGAPWLGHADDGSLIKLEFFSTASASSTLCRTNITHAFGGSPTRKSPFTASSELKNITWDNGQSRGSYFPESRSITASVASNARMHEVVLEQVTAEDRPELATFRKSVPDDQSTQAAHKKFADSLEKGSRWWKSGVPWDKIASAENLAADGNYLGLIRPAGKKQPIIPRLEPGAHFNLPIVCHLPPGSAIAEADTTVGIVAELHHSQNVQATWILNLINPGAIVQDLTAQWVSPKGEPFPAGPAKLYIYLAKTRTEGEVPTTAIDQPISNLLEVEIEIEGTSK
jgi:hypothetical protein